jgi:hypothetical protein
MATGASKSHFLEAKELDAIFAGTAYSVADTYVALFTALTVAQGEAGTGGTEVVGGSYARQHLTGATGGAGAGGYAKTPGTTGDTASFNAVNFAGMPACTVVGLAIYDAPVGGNELEYITGLSLVVAAGNTLQFAAATGLTVLED